MRAKIELNLADAPGDIVYLNFWNPYNGDDVICEIIDNELFINELNEEGEINHRNIKLSDFVGMVGDRMKTIRENL